MMINTLQYVISATKIMLITNKIIIQTAKTEFLICVLCFSRKYCT